MKEIKVDFLYFDLSVCDRCQQTEGNLTDAINELSPVLSSIGYVIEVESINITTKELAVKHRFLSSPTIRINGRDIADGVKENCCDDCGSLCGESVDCRVFSFGGVDYNSPPKGMIIDAVLRSIYTKACCERQAKYTFPKNLEVFFTPKGANDNE